MTSPTAEDILGITPEELLLAETEGSKVETVDDASALLGQSQDPSGTRVGSVTHSSPGMRRAYKQTPLGWMPRMVSAANLPMLIRAGWKAACPDCGRANCGVNGDLNDCPGRPPRALRICPVPSCSYKIYDDLPIGEKPAAKSADPNVISDGLYEQSTPASRTEALYRAHMFGYHPQEAPTYGVYQQVAPQGGFVQQGGR